MAENRAVFFDVGETLANPVFEAGLLARLAVYPFVADVMTRLRAAGGDDVEVAVGLISNTGDDHGGDDERPATGVRTPGPCRCRPLPIQLGRGLGQVPTSLLRLARERADVAAASCVFVGEDAAERAVAASVGFRVSPHPLHALHLVETESSTNPHV